MSKKSHVSRPVYPGGTDALKRFVAEHLNYPAAARAAGVSGTVVVRYTLDYTGKVVEAFIKRGLGHGCDEEALRVVRLLRFNVHQGRKKKVRIHQDLNIHFGINQKVAVTEVSPTPPPVANPAPASPPAPKTIVQPTRITYVPGKAISGKVTAKPRPGGYRYTITVK